MIEMSGATKDHFSFSLTAPTFNFITARGTSQTFAYHAARSASVVTLVADGLPTAVCDGAAVGQLCSTDGGKVAQPGVFSEARSAAMIAWHAPRSSSGYRAASICCMACGATSPRRARDRRGVKM